MATKNITQLDSATLPIQDADLFIISRDGVTLTKGQASALKSYLLTDGSITGLKLATDSVTTTKIQDLAVTTSKYANSSVTYAKIQNVTPGRILGRGTDAGSGPPQEIPFAITAAGGFSVTQAISPDIRSENFLRDTSGNEYHGCVQIVSKLITVQGSQVFVGGAGDTLIGLGLADTFEMQFTPRLTGSLVKLTFRMFGEFATAWDFTVNVHRNSARLNNPSAVSNLGLTMPKQTYGAAADANSTPEIIDLITLDKTGTVAGTPITYRLVGSVGSNQTVWINRCFGGAGTGGFEAGVSEIIIEEFAQ